MFISRACLWLVLAVPAWSHSNAKSQPRLNVNAWDINDLYSRITNAFSTPHKKQPRRPEVIDATAIDNYYNDFWENYYFHNPPYIEYVPLPRPPPRPRPTRRPRRTTTTTTTSTSRPTTRTPVTTTTTASTSTTPPTIATTPRTTSQPTTEPPTEPGPTPNSTTNSPIVVSDDYADDLQPEQQLSVKSPPQSMSSLCRYHPKLCDEPEEAHFMELADGNGDPLIIISPATTTRKPFRLILNSTRRYQSQRIYNSDSRSIYKISAQPKARNAMIPRRSKLKNN